MQLLSALPTHPPFSFGSILNCISQVSQWHQTLVTLLRWHSGFPGSWLSWRSCHIQGSPCKQEQQWSTRRILPVNQINILVFCLSLAFPTADTVLFASLRIPVKIKSINFTLKPKHWLKSASQGCSIRNIHFLFSHSKQWGWTLKPKASLIPEC